MKKIFLLIIVPFVFFPALSAQITQEEADEIVLEHISLDNATPYTLFANEELQAEGMTIALSTGEVFELDYACWAYYISYPNTGRFMIVKESNGNLLKVNAKVDAGDLATWKLRVIEKNDDCYIEDGIYTGTFTNGNPSLSGIMGLELKDGKFKGGGNPNDVTVPYGGTAGTFSINGCKITFKDEMVRPAVGFWFFILNGEYDYTFDGKNLKFSDGIYEYNLKKQEEEISNCDQDVIISADEYENAPNFPVVIVNMKIVDDCLKIGFGSSGCNGNTWVVKLIDSEIIAESIPCQRTLRLSLDSKEMCEAWISKEISFNIKDLQIQGDNKVVLNISGKSILYEYKSEKITPVLIGKGELYGNGKEGIIKQNLVVKTKEEWNNLMNAMNSVNNESRNFTETDIDFSNYQVIALFDEIRSSGGWSIDITDITEYQDEIIVTVENLQKGGMACVMTQPYHIVKIPKSDKKIIFDDKTGSLQKILDGYVVKAIAFDSKGNAWIGTQGQGLIRYNENETVIYNSENSVLPKDFVIWDIAVDKNDNVWIGANDGVWKYDGIEFTFYNSQNTAMPEDIVRSIAVDSKNNIWMASCRFRQGGLVKYDGNTWTAYTPDNSPLPTNSVKGIAFDKSDNVWLSLSDYVNQAYLVKISTDRWDIYDENDLGFKPYYFGGIQCDSKNRLWGAIDYSLSDTWVSPSPHFFIFDEKQTTPLSCGNDVRVTLPRITIDNNDDVWCYGVGSVWGVWIGEQWKQLDNSVFGGANPWIIKEATDHRIWFGTENGIYIRSVTLKQLDDE